MGVNRSVKHMEFYTSSPQETEDLGRRLGQQLHPGAVVAYYGDLGAGKTAFTRGLARGLGIEDAVTSPTYTIVNEYPGKIPLFHFDMYRSPPLRISLTLAGRITLPGAVSLP